MREQLEEKIKLYETLRDIPFISGACAKTGISRSTVYRWLNEDALFKKKVRKAINRGNEMVNDIAYGKLIQKIKEGDFRAIVYQLSRQHPLYKNNRSTDVKVNIDQKKEAVPRLDLERAVTEACVKIKISKLPKRLRRRVIKGGMDIYNMLEEVAEETYKQNGVDLRQKGDYSKIAWWSVLRDILEQEPDQRPKKKKK